MRQWLADRASAQLDAWMAVAVAALVSKLDISPAWLIFFTVGVLSVLALIKKRLVKETFFIYRENLGFV